MRLVQKADKMAPAQNMSGGMALTRYTLVPPFIPVNSFPTELDPSTSVVQGQQIVSPQS